MAQNDCDLPMFKCTLHFHECFQREEKEWNRRRQGGGGREAAQVRIEKRRRKLLRRRRRETISVSIQSETRRRRGWDRVSDTAVKKRKGSKKR